MHSAIFEQLRPDILTHYLSILQTVVEFNAGALSMEFGLHAFMKYDCVRESTPYWKGLLLATKF